MARPFKGRINIDIKDPVPDWEPYRQPMAPGGSPSVLYVVLDDDGFSAMEPFGGTIAGSMSHRAGWGRRVRCGVPGA